MPWSPSPSAQNPSYQPPASVPTPNMFVHPVNGSGGDDTLMGSPHIHEHLGEQPQQIQDPSARINTTAQDGAGSTASSTANVENATAIWVDLLLKDAAAHNFDIGNFGLESGVANLLASPSMVQSPVMSPPAPTNSMRRSLDVDTSLTSNPYLLERAPSLSQHQRFEKQAWHSEIPLRISPHEHLVFQNFVRNTSLWMDLFDSKRPFATHVPHLAVCRPCLTIEVV